MTESLIRVMVVEDSPEFQELLVLTLSLEPYIKIVHIASSGEDALKAMDKASPELVLLDFRLPGIDGLETAKRMKEKNPDVKIALVTAYAEEVLERAAKEANVEEVIPKSTFSMAKIQHLLGRES